MLQVNTKDPKWFWGIAALCIGFGTIRQQAITVIRVELFLETHMASPGVKELILSDATGQPCQK